MKRIPFDIKYRPEIEAGKYKVITRDGQPVRVICWDRNSIEYPIVALVTSKCGEETDCTYGKRGNYFLSDKCDNDLVLVTTEPELTEFEKAIAVYCFPGCDIDAVLEGIVTREIVRSNAKEILALAKKELEKDLPRWRSVDAGGYGAMQYRVYLTEEGPMLYDQIGHKEIRINDLEKLPKEDEK